jgi:hypothetical protein
MLIPQERLVRNSLRPLVIQSLRTILDEIRGY